MDRPYRHFDDEKLAAYARYLRGEVDTLPKREREFRDTLRGVELEQDVRRFPCECVRWNAELGIHGMDEQERRGRQALTLGLVCWGLTAAKDCSRCHGTGIPKP